MKDHRLSGRSILIIDDQLIVAMDLTIAFEDAGANVVVVSDLDEALKFIGTSGLSGAVVDFPLGNKDSQTLCAMLDMHHVPFILHSGHGRQRSVNHHGIVIAKPADPQILIDALAYALQAQTLASWSNERQPARSRFTPMLPS